MKTILSATVAAAVLLLAAVATPAAAQSKWDMPTPYPDGNYHTQNAKWFGEEVKKATNGGVDIVVHSNNSLIKLPEMMRAVQTGQVPIADILLSQFGNEDALLEIDGIPFFAIGFDQSYKLYQAQKALLDERLKKRGIRLLYSVAWPGQGLYSKTALNSLADYKGVKFRTYNPATAKLATLMGAVPTTVQAAEVSQAFATNIIQAMITSGQTGVDTKAWEYSKFFYDTKAMHPRNGVIVNMAAFEKLPAAAQKAMTDKAAEAEKRGWDLARAAEAATVKQLGDNGMTIVKPEPALMAEFSKIGQTMIDEWVQKAGEDGKKLVDAFRK